MASFSIKQSLYDLESTPGTISTIFSFGIPTFIYSLVTVLLIATAFETFRKPFFILLNRDLRFVCQSIYLKTINSNGINIDGLEKSHIINSNDLLENIVNQVCIMNNKIQTDLKLCSTNYIEINYSNLCNSPSETLNSISLSYNKLQHTQKNSLSNKINSIIETKDVKLTVEKWNHLETLLADRHENIN